MVGDEAEEAGLKSQRPRRRKQAGHVARAGMGDGSACHPKRARVKASLLMGGAVFVGSA